MIPLLLLKLSKFCRRSIAFSSLAADSEFSYLNKDIKSFLFSSANLDLRTLLCVHGHIIATGYAHNRFVASKLISHYASLSQPSCSTKIFDSLVFKDFFLWNSIIKAHFSNGDFEQSIETFSKMRFSGTLPDEFTLPMVVSACGELGLLSFGIYVHGLVTKLNLFSDNSAVGGSFVYMYSKCGDLDDAQLVFDEIPAKDVVSWTALVIGYVQNDQGEKGLESLCEMHRISGENNRPNFRTLEGGFQACGDFLRLKEGNCLHGLALKSGIVTFHTIQSAILSMYSKCGSIEDSLVSFGEIEDKDLLSWTSIVAVYAASGFLNECFGMFGKMQGKDVYPDGILISCLLSVLSNSMKVGEGKAFHGVILRRNYDTDLIVKTSLLSMYCKFGLLAPSEKLFVQCRNHGNESWNLMVVGFEKAGSEMKCLNLFRDMQHQGIESDSNSLISVVSSCARLGPIESGISRSIHCHIIKTLMFEDVSLLNSLISMYGKCRNLILAQRVFDHSTQDIATWNCLISSYTRNENPSKALILFDDMISKGLIPSTATLVTSLSACAQMASIENGTKIHDYIRKSGIAYDTSIATSLIDMYAKCGDIGTAREIFNSTKEKDTISWNVMISCYGMHGLGNSAIEIFQQMEQSGAEPNELTFLALLSACAHSGLINEGKSLFRRMDERYSIKPTLKHYSCMVDLYGRSGRLDEAEAVISSMPFDSDGGLWGSLLTSCKTHNDAEMGIRIAKQAIESDPGNDGYYVVLSDLYSSMDKREEVQLVRKMMEDRVVRKTVGWSTI